MLCALDCIADNVLELYRSSGRSSGLGVNGNAAKLLLRCAALPPTDVEPEAMALPPTPDVELLPSPYVKLDAFALDAFAVVADAAAVAMDDSTDGNECVPLNCCAEDVENAAL